METFLQNSMNGVLDQYQGAGTLVVAVSCVMGLLETFFGYKLQKFWISAAGVLLGFVLGFAITEAVSDAPNTGTYAVIIGLVVGLLGGFIAFKAYKFGVFIFAAWSAFSIIYSVFPHSERNLGILVGIIAAVLVGILSMVFIKPVMIISSAVNGALTACTAGFVLADYTSNSVIMVVASLALALLGIIVQFGLAHKKG